MGLFNTLRETWNQAREMNEAERAMGQLIDDLNDPEVQAERRAAGDQYMREQYAAAKERAGLTAETGESATDGEWSSYRQKPVAQDSDDAAHGLD
jgi:hypothetical protein